MAPRDDDKAMDGLLRRSLAREQGVSSPCPEPDILAAYFEQSLDADEMAGHELHFAQCSRCRKQLAAMLRAETVAEIPVAQESSFVAAAAPRAIAASRASATEPEPRKGAGISVFDWRWLAPVAAAIVVVVFLHLRDSSRVASLRAPSTEVALSRDADVPQPAVSDSQSGVQQYSARPTAPAATQLQLPTVTKNRAAKLAPKLSEKRPDLPSGARAEYKMHNDLRKRAEADTSTAMENSVPAETSAPTVAGTPSNNSDLAAKQPAAVSAPPPPSPAKLAANESAPGLGGASAQGGATSTMMSKKAQATRTTDAVAVDKLAGSSQLVEAKSAGALIQTPDASVQYRIAGAGAVERSQDGGATWQGQILNSSAEILAGAAPSEGVCWLVGRRGIILLTIDGKNWAAIPPPAKTDFVGVVATDATSATVTSAAGRRYATVDGGSTWKLLK
jgi:hypothetical protein